MSLKRGQGKERREGSKRVPVWKQACASVAMVGMRHLLCSAAAIQALCGKLVLEHLQQLLLLRRLP